MSGNIHKVDGPQINDLSFWYTASVASVTGEARRLLRSQGWFRLQSSVTDVPFCYYKFSIQTLHHLSTKLNASIVPSLRPWLTTNPERCEALRKLGYHSPLLGGPGHLLPLGNRTYQLAMTRTTLLKEV